MWWFCKNAISSEDRNAMEEFIAKHREEIAGVLSGFDRLIFRGTLRSISYPEGMMGYLWAKQVRLTEFGRHVPRSRALPLPCSLLPRPDTSSAASEPRPLLDTLASSARKGRGSEAADEVSGL